MPQVQEEAGRGAPAMKALRNLFAEAALFRRRALLAGAMVLLASVVLVGRYFELQVQRHDEFRTRAEANRIKLRPLPPARGLIYDRNGVLLAENLPAYRLVVIPESVEDIDATLDELARLIAIDAADLTRFRAEYRISRRFRPVTLKFRLDEAEMARFAVNSHRLPGVEIAPYFTRHYPLGADFAHVVGYVGRIAETDLARINADAYTATTHIGKSGIEREYEKLLHGATGVEQIETNAQGRELRVLARKPARPGRNLHLSIDASLQRSMANAFAGQPGAAVALDPDNGEVLAMVSLPTFDPNLFVNGISHADYRELTKDPSQPMFDRVLDGTYAPGSTVKPFMGLAGLELGLRTPEATTLSTGAFRLAGQGRDYRDWKAGGHGAINLRESLAQSVNTYYYKLAHDMGIDRMSVAMQRYGFGHRTGIDLPGEETGVMPTREWKRRRFQQEWYPGETVVAGIGQGFWTATPLQLAQGIAAIATGRRQPVHLLRESQAGLDAPRVAHVARLPADAVVVFGSPENLAAVREGLTAALHGPTGTARASAAGSTYLIAGKTGTAQRVGRTGTRSLNPADLPMHLRHRALFVGFAPADAPRIAIAVVAEHGGAGSRVAAPIARKVMDAWLLGKDVPPAEVSEAPAAPLVTASISTTAVSRSAETALPGDARLPVPQQIEPQAPAGTPSRPHP